MSWDDTFFDWLGSNKYRPLSNCLISDYVLVNMITTMEVMTGLCSLIIALILFVCYRNGNNMLRVSVVILKDQWILKLVSVYMILLTSVLWVSAMTVNYAIYNLLAVVLAAACGVSVWTIIRLLSVTFDQTRQASILDEVLTGASGDIPDYGSEPVDGRIPDIAEAFSVVRPRPQLKDENE